jgi:lipid-binding SYLF domain-containing protein
MPRRRKRHWQHSERKTQALTVSSSCQSDLLSQLSIGFQWGGQAYSEFIFFQDTPTLENFKQGNYELNAQASAVAVTAGASADAAFVYGMAIFTQAKGGLMYEAAVGGQKFKVELK